MRSYARELCSSIEITQQLKGNLSEDALRQKIESILKNKKKLLAAVQDVILQRDNTLEECNDWVTMFYVQYLKTLVKVSSDRDSFVIKHVLEREEKRKRLHIDIVQDIESEVPQNIVNVKLVGMKDRISSLEEKISSDVVGLRNMTAAQL